MGAKEVPEIEEDTKKRITRLERIMLWWEKTK